MINYVNGRICFEGGRLCACDEVIGTPYPCGFCTDTLPETIEGVVSGVTWESMTNSQLFDFNDTFDLVAIAGCLWRYQETATEGSTSVAQTVLFEVRSTEVRITLIYSRVTLGFTTASTAVFKAARNDPFSSTRVCADDFPANDLAYSAVDSTDGPGTFFDASGGSASAAL